MNPCVVGPTRTKETHCAAVQQLLNSEEGIVHVQGVKHESIFNALQYFHICSPGLPPCLGHDLFEGIVSSDVALCLKYFITKKRWFTYVELNRSITLFLYCGFDKNNKLSEININSDTLNGHAVQNWCFIRLLPLIIGSKIKEYDDNVWMLLLQLRDIIEYVCAPQICESAVAYLSIMIDEYLEDRHRLFPDCKMKPKHHYLKHYPGLILQFGPLINVWPMRFESKHSYFKRCVRFAPNFINVCHTLAQKHQLLQAYKCASTYFPDMVEMSSSFPLYMDTFNTSVQALLKQHFTSHDQVTYELMHKGTAYKKGDYVVVGSNNIGLLVGEISMMVLSNEQVFLIVKIFQSVYSFDLHVHMIRANAGNENFECIEINSLLDYFPLPKYGSKNSPMIPLKHAITVTAK